MAEADLGNTEIAAEAYQNAMATSLRDVAAADALENIYTRVADYTNLVLLLQRKVDMTARRAVDLQVRGSRTAAGAAQGVVREVERSLVE